MNKKNAPIIGIFVVFIFVFNLIAFIVANTYTSNFWSGYAFITLSWICLVTASINITHSREHEKYSLFLSIPKIVISLIYLLFELVAGISIMLIPDFNLKASIVIQVLIFAVYLVVIFGVSFYKGMAIQKSSECRDDAAFKKTFVMQVENAKSRCKNPILKQKLVEIGELVKYSDSVSSHATAECETRITELFSQITANLYHEENTIAVSVCDEITILINQRNALCAAQKKH